MAAELTTLSDEADRINYSIGHQIGTDFKKQQVQLDETSIKEGLNDGQQAKEPRIDRQEMNSLLSELKRKISSDMREKALAQMKERQQKTDRIRDEGRAFMEANRQKEGVQVLTSGLQYRVITPGSGPTPDSRDRVSLQFRSRTLDGREINNTYKKGGPIKPQVYRMLPGLSEALQLMSPGAKWELYVPPGLAYRRQGPLAHHTIIIEAELLSIETSTAQQDKGNSE